MPSAAIASHLPLLSSLDIRMDAVGTRHQLIVGVQKIHGYNVSQLRVNDGLSCSLAMGNPRPDLQRFGPIVI